MSRVVYLHIGAPKTGTTYVQDRLTRNVASLARHGVTVPTKNRFVPADLFQFRAALDLLGQDWGGAPGHAKGAWPLLLKRLAAGSGTAIVSHEILAPIKPAVIARAIGDLTSGPLAGTEVHVVYSARDLGRQLPAAWQESIKQGRRWSFRRFLQRAEAGKSWFVRAFDLPTVLTAWGEHVPHDRIHLVTVPQRGQGEDLLWQRMCTAFGIDPAWAPLDSERANRSLGIAETHVVRQLNRRMERKVRREAAYDELVREVLAQQILGNPTHPSPAVRLPLDRFAWAESQAERWIAWASKSDIEIIGDLGELRPVRPAAGEPWHDPDRVSGKLKYAAAVDALDGMTRLAAGRVDPHRTLAGRVRGGVDRWRAGS